MPTNKEESDGEMEQEESSGSDSGSSHGSDTDTSDLDLDQCLVRKDECLDHLYELEQQFAAMKEQLFSEKLALLDDRLTAVRAGTAVEFLTPLRQLEEAHRTRQEVTLLLKRYRLANAQHRYDSEMLAAEQNWRSSKGMLYDQVRQELEERARRLEEDRRHVDIASDLWVEERARRRGRRASQADDGSRKKRPVTVTGPYIVYMLSDSDVLEDWAAIKKALTVTKRKADVKILRDVNALWGC
ncbi:breast cancer metastasis-suppressor 1-like protein [Pollicipes pollicipes]|uniref:breast cancer metastasis-suppressor 1-like protein n=1 Tax=Pollicipes pollicipes TaxID=41117 RepID=UPI001885840B|nr:breast cancer metastasis-suppressor 1-like protein [Pollicipes pollicipes]